jgi:hypothetical protein
VTDQRNGYDDFFEQQAKARQPSRAVEIATKYDSILADQDRQAAQVNALDAPNPDVAARANQYERDMGVPAALAQDDIKGYDTMARQRKVAALSEMYPAIGKFMADPRNSAVAHDDLDVLRSISQHEKDFWAGKKPAPLTAPDNAPTGLPGLGGWDTAVENKAAQGLDYLKSLTFHGFTQGAHDVVVGSPRALGQGLSMLEEGIAGLIQAVPENIADAKILPSAGGSLDDKFRKGATRSLRDVGSSIVPYLDSASAFLNNSRQNWHALSESLNPTTDSRTARALLNGVAMTPMSAAALAAAATGNPEVGAGMMAGMTGGQSYGTARDAGLDPQSAFAFGARDAAVEYGTEVIPAMAFFRDVQAGTPFFKRMMRNMMEEQVGEQTATALQDLNQWATIDANKGKTFMQYLAERPGAAYDTALAVAVSVGASNVTEHVVERAGKVIDARQNSAALTGLMDDAAASKTRTRDPEAFKKFVQSTVEGTPAENVHIPVEAVDKLMQTEGFEDKDGFFEALKPQIEEARVTGGDIVVPLADAATHLAGTSHWEALKDDARIDAGGLSVREALVEGDKVREEIANRGDQILQQSKDEATANAPTQAVFKEVQGQLKDIGRSDREASNLAAVYAARAEAWGSRLGITAKEYHDKFPVTFESATSAGSVKADASPPAATIVDQPPVQPIEAIPAKTLSSIPAPQEDGTIDVAPEVAPVLAEHGITVSPEGKIAAPDAQKIVAEQSRRAAGGKPKRRIKAPEAATTPAAAPVATAAPAANVLDQQHAPIATPLTDLPASSPGVFQPAREAAERYIANAGLPHVVPADYAKLSIERGARIAAAFEAMKHDPENPAVKAAYKALVDETLAQWNEIRLTGLQVEFVDGEDPYAGNPWGAVRDVRDNGHLWVFNTEDGYGQDGITPEDEKTNPMLAIVPNETWSGKQVRVNDVFRVVHDYFGHIKEGVGFRARGEENAWRMHSTMYSALARQAMTTETRGQNSWLNFGPHGEKNQTASVADTVFAEQKIGLMPAWVANEGAPEFNKPDAAAADKAMPKTRVVGEDGKPLVVYHGTPYEFGEFRQRPRPDWFSESPEQAAIYADPRRRGMVQGSPNIRPVYLDIKNPLDLGELPSGVKPQDWAESLGLPRDTFPDNDGMESYFAYNRPRFTAAAMAAGYDGLRVVEGGHVTWAPFHRSQIASIFDRPGEPRTLFQADENPVFYSALGLAIDQSKTARAPAAQWKATLQNAPGVKAEELEWSGVLEFLDMAHAAGETLSKEQLAKALNDGGIKTSEVVLGEAMDYRDQLDEEADAVAEQKADDLELEGDDRTDWINDNWQGIRHELENNMPADEGTPQFKDWSSDPENPSYRELLITLPIGQGGNPDRAPETHWDQPAVVAHVRFMEKRDVEGKRVLFIEEVQSDWHQKGRDQGYNVKISDAARNAAAEKYNNAYGEWVKSVEALKRQWLYDGNALASDMPIAKVPVYIADKVDETSSDAVVNLLAAQSDARSARDLAGRERDIAEGFIRNGIPDAPFRTSWPALTMKRAIRWAVDNGYERIAWTTGEQQAERYNLSTAVGTLTYRIQEDGRVKVNTHNDRGYEALRQYGEMGPAGSTLFTRAQAEETFGREIAGKMWAGEGGAPDSTGHRKLEGSDLRVGGEGMKAFYDRNLVNITNNLIKKHGTKVGAVALQGADRSIKRGEDAAYEEIRQRIEAQKEAARGIISSIRQEVPGQTRNAEDIRVNTDPRYIELNAEYKKLVAEAEARKVEILAERDAKNGQPGFDITPQLAAAATQGFPLFQNTDGPRGQIAIYPTHNVITLFENANLSTLLHETGHQFLEELKRNAETPGAPKDVKDDWQKVQAWFTDQKVPLRDGAIPREAHELWARGFERYAMEGKAPSASLKSAFAAFRGWLLRIYGVVSNLRSPISPEIREVFDRLLATQQQIDEYSKQQHVQAAFTDAQQAGMTEAEWAAYQKSVVEAKDDAYDALLFKTMHRIAQRRKQAHQAETRTIRAEAIDAVDADPRFKALRLLRTGKIDGKEIEGAKFDREWLTDRYGEDIESRLPANVRIGKEGMNADDLAALTGFGSGDEMIKALIGVQDQTAAMRVGGDKRQLRDKEIDDRTNKAVEAKGLTDPMADGSIEEEAIEAINNNKMGDVLATELRHLARRTKASPTPYRMAREWAQRKIEAGLVKDVASGDALQRYSRAAAKAARAAEAAIIDGKTDEAFKQKQAQMLNHALFVEAKAAKDEVETIVNRMNKLAKRAAMKSVDQDYMDKVHDLLERYDMRPRSQRYLDEVDGFEKWAAERAANGFEVHVPPRLNIQGVNYSRVSVEELYGLRDAVDSTLALGRLKQRIIDGQVEREFSSLLDEMIAKARELPDRKGSKLIGLLPNGKRINEILGALPETENEEDHKLRGFNADLIKIETLAQVLDGGDPNGPFTRQLVHRATDAENRRHKLKNDILGEIAKHYFAFDKKDRLRHLERVTIPELMHRGGELDDRNGKPVVRYRSELLGMALNTGNLSNFEKMTRGEKWNPQAVRRVLNRELTKTDWEFVQGVWDSIDKLFPDIAATERKMSGVVPERVTPTPFSNQHGDFRGGYFPVVYDADRSSLGERNADAEAKDMFGGASGVSTPKGHTITRTNAVGPLDYTIENVLFRHINQVATRIAYADYARDILRTFNHDRIKTAIDLKLGREYRKQIIPWLDRTIHDGRPDLRSAKWANDFFRGLRGRMTLAVMGFKASVGIAQLQGITASAAVLADGDTLGTTRAYGLLAKSYGRMFNSLAHGNTSFNEFVNSRSPEMARRGQEVNREIVELNRRIRGNESWKNAVERASMWHIAMVDRYAVALPTWLAAHDKGIGKGMTDEQASRYADGAVRKSQGSGSEKDLAKVQSASNGELMKWMTLYYSYFSAQHNQMWTARKDAQRGNYGRAIQLTAGFVILAPLLNSMFNGDMPGQDDDPEAWITWFTSNIFFNLFGGIPGVRDVANFSQRKLTGKYASASFSPMDRLASSIETSGREAYALQQGTKDVDGNTVKTALDTLSYATPIAGANQAGNTIKFLWDYNDGKAQPDNLGDWFAGVTKGKVPKKDQQQ